jgi:hypothetical protein
LVFQIAKSEVILWNFASERVITNLPNPRRGVKGFAESGCDVYVGDEIYQAVYEFASGPLMDALDLAYMTDQRPADVRDGLLPVTRGKTTRSCACAPPATTATPMNWTS